jgi:hypothetical protein
MHKIFKLENSWDRPAGKLWDAIVHPYKGDNMLLSGLSNKANSYPLPDIVYFYANFNLLEINQFVLTELGVRILRNDMLELIMGKEEINYVLVPAIMIDQNFKNKAFDKNQIFNSNVPHHTNYSCLGMYDAFEAFDYENSEFIVKEYGDVKIVRASKLVLKSQNGYFPRIFQIREDGTIDFIRGDVKELLEKSGFGGFEFEEVEVSG